MAHFKCAACRGRIWRDGDGDAELREPCPRCGGPLEAILRPEEVIGLRVLQTGPSAPPSIADHVRETIARNDAARLRRLGAVRSRPTPPDGA